MIIFDLDGTLANIDHRRHFVDASYRDDCYYHSPATLTQSEGWYYKDCFLMCEPPKPKKFVPDWRAFYDACDKDESIEAVYKVYDDLAVDNEIEIWSGRCESVRDKTLNWLYNYGPYSGQTIKMRPIGDSTPDNQLKEKWLNERCSDHIEAAIEGRSFGVKHDIEFVFDDRPKVIRMWRRRGVFVFNCCQHDRDF
jgi:hypothetical protein